MSELILRNRQRRCSLNLRLLRRITTKFLEAQLGKRSYEIGVCIVAASEMARINESFLQHTDSTDVITFPYTNPGGSDPLIGDIFVCIDDALRQARQFGTSWQSELLRYFVHGVLHLQGYDDLEPEARRVLKRQENRLLRRIRQQFPIETLGRTESARPATST